MQFSYRSPTNNPYIELEYLKFIDIKGGFKIWCALYYQQEGERNLIFSL